MATLTFLGESYEVDHAVKGATYIHGFKANGTPVVSFDGVTDFSGFSYSGTYMTPEHCAQESCNTVRFVNGRMQTSDGRAITKTISIVLSASAWVGEEAPFSYTLNLDGVTATSNQDYLPAVGITTEQLEALQDANIVDGGQSVGVATLVAHGDKPEIDIPIRVILRGDA